MLSQLMAMLDCQTKKAGLCRASTGFNLVSVIVMI